MRIRLANMRGAVFSKPFLGPTSFTLSISYVLVTAVFRLGRFVQFVPKTVISGFMNGIAILIWVDQAKKLIGLAGQKAYEGPIASNVAVAVAAFFIAFMMPILANRLFPKLNSLLPGTLVAILIVTDIVQIATVDIQMTKTEKVENTLAACGAQ